MRRAAAAREPTRGLARNSGPEIPTARTVAKAHRQAGIDQAAGHRASAASSAPGAPPPVSCSSGGAGRREHLGAITRAALRDARRIGGNAAMRGDQSRSGPGSSSAPPLPAEPNFGAVNHPNVVVRGGFASIASPPPECGDGCISRE